MRDVIGKIIYYIIITMSEEPKWRKLKTIIIENHQNVEHDADADTEPYTDADTGTEPYTDADGDTDTDTDTENKIETVRAKKKGFSKFPQLENIYDTNPQIIEGFKKAKSKKQTKKTKKKKKPDKKKTPYKKNDKNTG